MKQTVRLIAIAFITLILVSEAKVASAQKAKPAAIKIKIIEGSKNLNGPGKYDQVLDSTDLNAVGNMTLLWAIQKKVNGFNEGLFPGRSSPSVGLNPAPQPPAKISYRILDKEAHFVIDGVDLDDLFTGSDLSYGGPSRDRLESLKAYLVRLSAEEVKGIEVMSTSRYYNKYYTEYLSNKESDIMMNTSSFPGYAFIEITTYGGGGPQ